jgi:alkylhydroperoxidase family enzyme
MPNDLSRADAAFEPAAIAEREALITGKPPRLPPMTAEEMGPEAMQTVRDIRVAVGLDPDGMTEVPDYMSTILRHTGLYRAFGDYGLQLLKGVLAPRDRELAILRTGWLCRAPFEWAEHVAIGQRCGVTQEEIERVTRGSADPAWSANDRAILRAVEELHADAMITDETWAELAKFLDQKQLIELPFLIGHYHQVAFYQNAIRLRPPPGSLGLAAR